MKKCTKCHKTKDESEYWSRGYRKRSGKKRLYSYCNICAREAERLYRANNPDKVRKYDTKTAVAVSRLFGNQISLMKCKIDVAKVNNHSTRNDVLSISE